MTFLRPDLAPWALLVPLIVAFWMVHRYVRGVGNVGVLVSGTLAAAALAVALLRPQATFAQRLPEYEREDLVIMLDRSASMQARDIQPSRFARATLEIRNFIRQKPEGIDRIALIGFADAAVVLSYLTDDTDSLLFYFDWIDADPTPLFGTNIGAALKSAMDVARKDDRPTRKLFLIVSDGEDYGTELRRAVIAARAEGYQVNCIGIGGGESVPIPIRSADGRETLLRDDTGTPLTTRFAEKTLSDIAAATGGRYVRSATGDELRRAIDGIVAGERRVVGWRTLNERRDLYQAFLAIAALAGAILWVRL